MEWVDNLDNRQNAVESDYSWLLTMYRG